MKECVHEYFFSAIVCVLQILAKQRNCLNTTTSHNVRYKNRKKKNILQQRKLAKRAKVYERALNALWKTEYSEINTEGGRKEKFSLMS